MGFHKIQMISDSLPANVHGKSTLKCNQIRNFDQHTINYSRTGKNASSESNHACVSWLPEFPASTEAAFWTTSVQWHVLTRWSRNIHQRMTEQDLCHTLCIRLGCTTWLRLLGCSSWFMHNQASTWISMVHFKFGLGGGCHFVISLSWPTLDM